MEGLFHFDERLGISVPTLTGDWHAYSTTEQDQILLLWEHIRGIIPDRIGELEIQINTMQDQLSIEEDFECSCKLNFEISELASVINDLWIWYRTQEEISPKNHH